MLREIRKKMVILHNRVPFRPEVKTYLEELEAKEWIYMNLRLSGSSLSRENIDTILGGGYILEASIEEHLMIKRLQELRNYIYRLTDMGAELSLQILKDMHGILTGEGSREDYRKGSPLLLEYGVTPMMAADIPAAMEELAAYAAGRVSGSGGMEEAGAVFSRAARIHNRLLEIYPFRDYNAELARAAMYYCLVSGGCPLAALDLSEQDYNFRVIRYLDGGSSLELEQDLLKAVLNRLELMIQLTGYEN